MVRARRRMAGWLIVALVGVAAGGVAAQKPKPPVKPKPAAPKVPAPAPTPVEPPKPQQWKVVSRYVADGVETLTTVYAGGKRQRVELPGGTAIITQCDLSRAVQVNDRAKAYAIVPFAAPAAAPTATGAPLKPGASVLVRTTGTDTGEKREMFGQQARHLKLVTTTEPSPQACDKKKGRIETDGWFADIPELQECAGAKAQRAPVETAGTCRDPRVEEHAGIDVGGFPLAYSVVAFDAAGKEISKLVVDVTALTREDLSAPLFEPPPAFAALPDAGALAAAARRVELEELGTTPKLAGMIRIGVAPPGDRSGKGVAADNMRGLLEDFNTRPFEAVPLSAGTAEEQQAEARKKECDYVVRAELGSLTTSTPGKVGGLVRRASGGGNPTEIHEAGVALELIPVSAGASRAKKLTASAKTGAFTWRQAVGLARFAGKIYFGMSGGMMKTLMSSSGAGGGGPLGGGDPTVNAIMMLLGPAASGEETVDLATPGAVVAAAFQKAAADAMKELQPK
jgi:hypothetical protein